MKKKENLFKKLLNSREFSLIIVLAILCAFIQFRNDTFLTSKTIADLFKNYATSMTIALGMMLVLLIGGIDICIGAELAFAGMCASLMMRDGYYTSTLVMFIVSTVIGTACGALVGLIISKGHIQPIIATLGMSNIYRGATYLASKSAWVSAYQFDSAFKKFAQTKTLTGGLMNNLVFIMIVCYIIFFFVMRWTVFGRRVYAVGSNPQAAAVSGINVDRIKFFVYTIMGAFSGLVGAMYTSLYASAMNDMGVGMEMDAIASCVLGGVSLLGGQGSVVGVFLGALMMSIISKALPLIGISQFWKQAIKGVIILVAIIINTITQRTMDKNALKAREM